MGGFARALLPIDSSLSWKGHHQQCLVQFCRDAGTKQEPSCQSSHQGLHDHEKVQEKQVQTPWKRLRMASLVRQGCVSGCSQHSLSLLPSQNTGLRLLGALTGEWLPKGMNTQRLLHSSLKCRSAQAEGSHWASSRLDILSGMLLQHGHFQLISRYH